MAFEKYNEARILRKQLSGENDSLYIDALTALGRLCLKEKNYNRAEEYFKEALRIRKNIKADNDMPYIVNLQFMAETNF